MAVLGFIALLIIVPAPPAGAHPYLVQTSPGPGVVARNPPPAIEIGFTEAVVLEGSSLRLEDAQGKPVVLGRLRSPEGGPGLAADIKGELDVAIYRVRWVVLGDDGHTSSGDYQFGIQGPGGALPEGVDQLVATGGPSDQATAADGSGRIALRWVGLLGATLLLGGAVLVTRLRSNNPAEGSLDRWKPLSRLALGLVFVGAVAGAIAAASAGTGSTRLSVALATDTGRLALVRLGAMAVLGLALPVVRSGSTRDNVLGAVGALFLGAEAASGHVSGLENGRVVAGLIQATHVTAGGIWAGGLTTLAFLARGAAPSERVAAWRAGARRFGPVAGVSAAVVVVTGTVAAVREVEYRYFLAWSTYGRFLLVKIALVAVMVGLGGLSAAAVRARTARPAGATPRWNVPLGTGLRSEAALGVVVLVLAATVGGVARGRGQPLPAQRESVLAGPAFANTVVGGGLARLVLSPAAPGMNRFSLLMVSEPPAADAEGAVGAAEEAEPSPAVPLTGEITVSFTCACASEPVTTTLRAGGEGVWAADVDLPGEGVWRASLETGGVKSLAPVPLRVADEGFPGAPPVVVASTADLSGTGARRCRSFELGMLLALGFVNAEGGVNGRKVVIRSMDDGGDPQRARALAEDLAADGAALAAPCGKGSGAAAKVLDDEGIPVILADAESPVVNGKRVFRLAGDPFAEGWAMGRSTARGAYVGSRPDVPRRVSVLVAEGDAGDARAVEGVRAALAAEPTAGLAAAEGEGSFPSADIEVDVISRRGDEPLGPLVRSAIDPTRFAATFLRADGTELAAVLDSFTDEEVLFPGVIFVGPRNFEEEFVRGSRLARRGDVVMLGEVAPDSGESLEYTRFVQTLYPGERPTVDGLRGFIAGQAVKRGLEGGTGAEGIARRLAVLGPFTDGLVTGWSPAAPAAGSWRYLLFKGSFVPSGLQPGGEVTPGRFFPEGGAWSRVVSRNAGLCGPQERFAGKAPACEAPDG